MTSTNHNSWQGHSSTDAEVNQQISEYFSKRGNFLAKVIRADLQSLPVSFFTAEAARSSSLRINSNGKNGNGSNGYGKSYSGVVRQIAPVPSIEVPTPPTSIGTLANAGVGLSVASGQAIASSSMPESVESLLVRGVVEQTGYPVDSIALDARLLDDLNLDSIKAGELVGAVAKTCGVQGTLDPSALANATLSNIADAIRMKQQELGLDAGIQTLVPESSGVVQGSGLHNRAHISEQLLDLIVTQTGFPKDSLAMDLRLLDDLNLDSIKAAELIGAIAKQIGVEGQLDPSHLANATLADVVETLVNLQTPTPSVQLPGSGPSVPPIPAGVTTEDVSNTWVRNFAVSYVVEPYVAEAPEDWSMATVLVVCDRPDLPFVHGLQQHLCPFGASVQVFTETELESIDSTATFTHAIAFLSRPEDCGTELPLVAMAQRLRSIATLPLSQQPSCVTYVQFGGGQFGESLPDHSPATTCAAAFARSLHLERPQIRVRVIDLDPQSDPGQALPWVLQELSGSAPMITAGYDAAGIRRVPQSCLQQPTHYSHRSIAWSNNDVILVTGGAKGITAECALAIAQVTGVKMALVGRSNPLDRDDEREKTLHRFKRKGLTCRYYACDIANATAVSELVNNVTQDLGAITGIIHGAGLNTPRRVEQVSLEEAIAEVSPKLLGAYHLLQALDSENLKQFLAFSSIIGITGMPGNTWYAFANESLNLLLHQYHANHPQTSVISLAYSIWSEVGMGARMGSLKALARMGIDPIPPLQGIDRCVELFLCDPGTTQVAIAARLGGLDTWHPVPLIPTDDLRFIEEIHSIEPGVEVVVRSHLTLERDRYVQDHIWRGSYLFPTVFGLEAMAQAIACVTGNPQPPFVRIENIALRRPIVVNPDAGTIIEIRALVDEIDDAGAQRITVGIRTEQTGFKTEHFKAEFILGERPPTTHVSLDLPDVIELDPKVDLYNEGGLLFQGPLFQQLDQIYSLSRNYSLLKSHAQSADELNNPNSLDRTGFAPETGNRFVLGDPFFRDVLLQCMQVNIPQDICLPVQIDQLAIGQHPAELSGARIIQAILNFKEGQEYHCEVVASDLNGTVVEHLQGYRLRILEEHPENPTALELADPQQRDQAILDHHLNLVLSQMHLEGVTVKIAYLPQIGAMPKAQRHLLESPFVKTTVRQYLNRPDPQDLIDLNLDHEASGKPFVVGQATAGLDLSLSHDDHYCLCSLGESQQGCDIDSIYSRSSEDWRTLLGNERFGLVEELISRGDTLDRSAMRVWSAVEAIRKAAQGADPQFAIAQWHKDAILLETSLDGELYKVVTLPIQLTRKPERMVALVVTQTALPTALSPIPDRSEMMVDVENIIDVEDIIQSNSHRIAIKDDGPQGQKVYERRFCVAFKEACSISRRVTVSQFIRWVGENRELPMRSIAPLMLKDFLSGNWALVTNQVSLRLLGETTTYETIQARCWLDHVVDSTFNTYLEFCKVLPDDTLERVAIAEVKATWVQMKQYGIPAPAPLPHYLKCYLDRFAPSQSGEMDLKQAPSFNLPQFNLPQLPENLTDIDVGELLYEVPLEINHYGDLLLSELFQTTLEEANVVGNVYYGNYFTWQGRMLDLFLYQTAPNYLRVSTATGEMVSLFSRMNFLKEAMPFDRVRVKLYVKTVTTCGADFRFEYFREHANGDPEKLQVGEQQVIWAVRQENGDPQPAPWPELIRDRLLQGKPAQHLLSV